jgi:very-short-patch-repair endonuclease
VPQKVDNPDRLIAQIASRQHGVISLQQLLWAGLSYEAVRNRVRTGRLHRVHRGVFAVGRADLSMKGRWKAATLALGAGAVLSHRSAAELWQTLPVLGGPIHVTIVGSSGRVNRDGIRLHRFGSLRGDTTSLDNIPVTNPARTLADLRRVLTPEDLRNAIRAGEVRGLPIGDYAHLVAGTRSELEWLFLELVRRNGLPDPEVNVRVGRFLVDFLWRDQRLIVETDGERYHRGQLAKAEDLLRDHLLREMGFEVLRFGYWEIVNEPRRVLGCLCARFSGR